MNNDTRDLQALVGKNPDADFLRDMIGSAATRLMEREVVLPAPANLHQKVEHNRS